MLCRRWIAAKVADHFMPTGWLRDALEFSWDYRALEGHDNISSYLLDRDVLAKTAISEVTLDTREGLAPESSPQDQNVTGIQFAFRFETPSTRCRGLLLRCSLVMKSSIGMLSSCLSWSTRSKGTRRSAASRACYEGHTRPWGDVKAERVAEVERNPYTVISE